MTRPDCPKCGQDHERCNGHRRDGQPCNTRPMQGQQVCRMHGGMAPQNLAAAARRLARDEAVASLAEVEVTAIDDPLDKLADLAAEAWAAKDHFANMVAELGKNMAFVTGKATLDEDGRVRLEQKLDARVALYERALDRCQKYLSDWVRLGFEERKVQLDEIRTARVVAFVRGVLRDHGIDTDADDTRTIMRSWQPVLNGDAPPT